MFLKPCPVQLSLRGREIRILGAPIDWGERRIGDKVDRDDTAGQKEDDCPCKLLSVATGQGRDQQGTRFGQGQDQRNGRQLVKEAVQIKPKRIDDRV